MQIVRVRECLVLAMCTVAGCGGDRVAAPTVAHNPAAASASGSDDAAEPQTIEEMVAEIDQLQQSRPEAASREEFVERLDANQRRVVELGEKVLARELEPVVRDHVRDVSLRAIAVLAQTDPSRRKLLGRADQLADAVLADDPDGPRAASAELLRAFVYVNIESVAAEEDAAVARRLLAMVAEVQQKFPEDERSKMLSSRVEMLAGKALLKESIGKPLEIAGPTLGHGSLDIAQYKGKVVLVDFWATWCGPCVQELPNVRAVYDKFRDRGFDVIGVSLDRGRSELASFVQKEALPWPQLFFDEDGKRFWDNPLVRKYGIDGIPATFLMDRAGTLRRVGVRGRELESAVAELVNEPAPMVTRED